jgi:hypothetical protein
MKTKTSSKKVLTPFFLRQSARRSFLLGPILVLVALTGCCEIRTWPNPIVFNTLAPDCTYEQFGGYFGIQKPPPAETRYWETAAKFTAMTSGNLATVDLGLTKWGANAPTGLYGGPASVFLYRDAAGSPNIATQTYLGTVAPTGDTYRTNNSLVSLLVAGTVPVVQGLDYWLVLKPAARGVHDCWNLSLPRMAGSSAVSHNDVTWRTFNDEYLPAFRITAKPVSRIVERAHL